MIKQYKAIARIVESGKRIGFIVEIQTDNAKKKTAGDVKFKSHTDDEQWGNI